ncbi:MAG: sulfatase-like hydrolase/transferase [Candidatus Poribacteria bacterium]|nr:sulfatase-like hydrolase/transferase [Candidatus Poribacteria bacterium]
MNIVFLFSDEHAGSIMGNSGHPVVQTPHLDRLAEQSYTFDNAYCNYPICTPSRLSMLTGRYPHQIEAWDLGAIADRQYQTWGDYLARADYETVLCGRTHFNGTDRLLGFSHRLLDDLHRWRHTTGRPPRRTPDARRGSNSHVAECGPGDHEHTRYDRNVTDLAVDFLQEKAASPDNNPFLLYCGFMHPHFPLIAPPEFYALYDPDTLELPETWNEALESQHPIIRHHRWSWRNDIPPPEAVVRCALASYYALVSCLDAHIGRILEAIDTSPLRENTLVLYTSDHGEMAGHHGIWQKQCFYEPAVRVPLMVRLPSGENGRVAQNVSLVDVLPTLLEVAGLETPSDLPGDSLLRIARNQPNETTRTVFSEYHHMGMLNAGFMLKRGNYKLCHYVGSEPQLFNIDTDPRENNNLAAKPEYAARRSELETALRAILDPEREDARAKENQRVRRLNSRNS